MQRSPSSPQRQENTFVNSEATRRTREDRKKDPDAVPRYDILSVKGENGESLGLASLPLDDPADVYFDMEGYPLVAGGLGYLFGVYGLKGQTGSLEFKDWWAHDRDEVWAMRGLPTMTAKHWARETATFTRLRSRMKASPRDPYSP